MPSESIINNVLDKVKKLPVEIAPPKILVVPSGVELKGGKLFRCYDISITFSISSRDFDLLEKLIEPLMVKDTTISKKYEAVMPILFKWYGQEFDQADVISIGVRPK